MAYVNFKELDNDALWILSKDPEASSSQRNAARLELDTRDFNSRWNQEKVELSLKESTQGQAAKNLTKALWASYKAEAKVLAVTVSKAAQASVGASVGASVAARVALCERVAERMRSKIGPVKVASNKTGTKITVTFG